MKKLDKYIIKSFAIPFLATFLVILFVMVMIALWEVLDEISGKGIGMYYIFQFLYYIILMVVPQTIPIAILLSSIMAFGSMAENYEFAAIKSAGISFKRFIRPLVIISIGLGIFNYLFLDYVYPYAQYNQKNLFLNIKKKQPALALVAGSFNTEIPNFIIKFKKKYGVNNDSLRDVIIYDLSSKNGNSTTIVAKNGSIDSKQQSKYMTFTLRDGYYYQDHLIKGADLTKRNQMPFSKAHFETYTVNIDASGLDDSDLDSRKVSDSYHMLSLKQIALKSDTLKKQYDNYLESKAKNIALRIGTSKNKSKDTLSISRLPMLPLYSHKNQLQILEDASTSIQRSLDNILNYKYTYKFNRRRLNKYNIESHKRITASIACILLFLIGASFGSIIKKGGFGLPMILAIVIYLVFFFFSEFTKNLAEESKITAALGGWFSTLVFFPISLLLVRNASRDKGIGIPNFIYVIFIKFSSLFKKNKKQIQ